MIKKKLNKLVGLKKEEFDEYVKTGQIQVQPARLIPIKKTGDEGALTSIFLSTVRLVKEYRDEIFKELKLSRSGKMYYYVEASFPDIDKSRIDGLILIVIKGVIKEAAFFEMKNKKNCIEAKQIQTYLNIAKKLGVQKMVTVSNEFVADSTHSPVKVKPAASVSLFHFSWTYLLTNGTLLLFNNDKNIEDEDQVEIMNEVMAYMGNPDSGVSGYTLMKPGWKELAESVKFRKTLKVSDAYIEDAVLSWYEEEKDMALLMSRKLGVHVKSSPKAKDSIKKDIARIVKENYLKGSLSVKNSVSDIKVRADFERRNVSMSIKTIPPQDKGLVARISWINKQLENCKKKNQELFKTIESNIIIEADVKYFKQNLIIEWSKIGELAEEAKGKEIQAFHVVLVNGFGANFASNKKFIELIENMVLDYYEGIVQHMINWNRPAPKLN